MARNVTLTQIRDDARLYADIRTSDQANDHITDALLDRLINLQLAELHEILSQSGGPVFALSNTESTIAIVNGTASYALPAAFMMLLSVELTYSADDREELRSLSSDAELSQIREGTWGRGDRKGFRLSGPNIIFFPTPNESVTCTIRYVPAFVDLTSGAPTYDGVNGWEKFVSLGVAREVLTIQTRDSSRVDRLYMEQKDRIETMASERQAMDPVHIRIIDGHDRWWP